MISEYNRPKTIEEALELLGRKTPHTIPLGGGNVVTQAQNQPPAVVDLQNLGLDSLKKDNNFYHFGAMAKLSDIASFTKSQAYGEAISIDASKNQQNSGTIAGLIKTGTGRSPLLTLLLALDAQLIWEPEKLKIGLGNWLPIREGWAEGKLITEVMVPDAKIVFASIGRTPKDTPIVCCALSLWESKRMRVAAGGFGKIPSLVLDGSVSDDVEEAITSALHNSDDEWASANYRIEAASKLADRLKNELLSN